ncbi:hypothetical protein O3M35_004457 [Rhynocoris fuscipes]|uniref:Uncharacterized protein n=1 Tax=Rhynocoris fuscipes TaxID=488301 RepID=A0AAW1CHR7_9HEMI
MNLDSKIEDSEKELSDQTRRLAEPATSCLEDPSFSFDSPQLQDPKPTNSDILEKANNRFDQFWGAAGQENQEKTENI